MTILVTLMTSCGRKENGQLLGIDNRPKWKGINPYGMVYIQSGTLYIGSGDEDITKVFIHKEALYEYFCATSQVSIHTRLFYG